MKYVLYLSAAERTQKASQSAEDLLARFPSKLQLRTKLVEAMQYHTLFANHLTNERVETRLSPSPPQLNSSCFVLTSFS